MVVFLRQGIDAGEDAIGCLEACSAVVPVYAKERVLGFLPGVKTVTVGQMRNKRVFHVAKHIFQNNSDLAGIVERFYLFGSVFRNNGLSF